MPTGANAGAALEVVSNFLSPDGPTVLELRGGLIVSSLQHLKAVGMHQEYLQQLPAAAREHLSGVIAASWVPVELGLTHCAAIDALGLTERHLQEHGENIGTQISESMLSMMMRTARGMGLDKAVWWLLGQMERMWPRLYRGGGCTVLRAGPKDAILEIHGQPLFTSRFFRSAHHSFIAGIARTFSDVSYVKPARPREPHPHRAATAISWV